MMADDAAGRRMPFAFLSDLQRRFLSQESSSSATSFGSFSPVISSLMHTYNTNPPTDELTRAQNELNQVKDIMVQNVEQILSRGERIELLVDKTDNMASQVSIGMLFLSTFRPYLSRLLHSAEVRGVSAVLCGGRTLS